MAKENFKIFFCLFAQILLIVSAQHVMEPDDLSRSFTFTAVVNTSSRLDTEDQILAKHKARSAVHCAHKCLTNKQCQVIGFNAKTGVCWLMKSAGRNGVLKSQDDVILIKVRFHHEELAPKPQKIEVFSSCKEVLEKGRSKGNGVYNIKTNQTSTMTYCHMDTLPDCGDGGWTLTMKIDGSEDTFDYDSSYWTDRQALKTENGLGLEDEESKLPTYWSTPLTKICLGMKMNASRDIKWLKLELRQRANSLYDVMTTGYSTQQPYILLGANKWKDTLFLKGGYTIIDPHEGVSATLHDSSGSVRVRLGVVYSFSSHSLLTYLGFGTWGSWHQKYGVDMSCGYGRESAMLPYKKIPAFCYILVQ